MLVLKKLSDLKHVGFLFWLRLLVFQMRKTLHLKYPENDYNLNSFLTTHLLPYIGILLNEKKDTYTSAFCFDTEQSSGIILRKPPSSDFAVFDQVFVLKEYQPLVELVKQNEDHPKRPLNIIDAGGNIGLSSIFLNRAFPAQSLALWSPTRRILPYLKKIFMRIIFQLAR